VAAHADELDTTFLEGYVAQLENAIPFPTVRGGEEITTTVQTALEQMEFGQLSPQEAMETAQQEVQEILDR
jgi:multiple sugar transport system substrate-binding protein